MIDASRKCIMRTECKKNVGLETVHGTSDLTTNSSNKMVVVQPFYKNR